MDNTQPPARPARSSPTAETKPLGRVSIKVLGLGGGGCNAVNRMIELSDRRRFHRRQHRPAGTVFSPRLSGFS
jgi:hypothetical protein